MPIYEYLCNDCGDRFELLRPFSRADEAGTCPHCQGKAERIMSCCAVFSKSASGASTPLAGSGGCAGCSAGSCTTCAS